MADPPIVHKVGRDGQALIVEDDPVTGKYGVVGSPRLATDQTQLVYVLDKEQ